MPKKQNHLTATGAIEYQMTNDFMFRTILQRNEKVLRGLVSSLLHMQPKDIESITIENPIDLGEFIDDKDLILDIRVRLNNKIILNLEMQVVNQHNWTERSLLYLCRAFDQLKSGQPYEDILPTIHIGFVDFRLFEDLLEFYSIYKLLNIKNHHLYSDKFAIHVVDLNCIDFATDEDKSYGIDHWARLFKATTWEEMRMIAENNEYLNETMQALYESNADPNIREKCRARATQIWFEEMNARKIEHLSQEIKEKDAAIAEKDATIAEKDAEIQRLRASLEARNIPQ